jgi:hypothetical protein
MHACGYTGSGSEACIEVPTGTPGNLKAISKVWYGFFPLSFCRALFVHSYSPFVEFFDADNVC